MFLESRGGWTLLKAKWFNNVLREPRVVFSTYYRLAYLPLDGDVDGAPDQGPDIVLLPE